MSRSSTLLDRVDFSTDLRETTINANSDALSPAGAFGRHASACVALHWAGYGGTLIIGTTPTTIANWALDLTDNATNYIRISDAGIIDFVTTAPPGWPAKYLIFTPLFDVTFVSGFATWNDWRSARGLTGAAGVTNGIPFVFSTTTTDADPGNGFLRLSNATQNASTVMRVDLLDALGTDRTGILDTFDASTSVVKGQITLINAVDTTKWLSFNITARATPSGYRNLTVAAIGGSAASPFANNDQIVLFFSRTGDAGTFSFTMTPISNTIIRLTYVGTDTVSRSIDIGPLG